MRRRRKRKGRKTGLLLLLITAILTLVLWFYSRTNGYKKANMTHYPAFGIAMPDNYSVHGIDVSRYQEIIAWEEVKAMQVKQIKLSFAFIKATEGIGNKDPQFARNWKQSKANGIIRGAYHFFSPSKGGLAQADNFINQVRLGKGDLPPVLDIEHIGHSNPDLVKKEAKAWLLKIEAQYGAKPIIYTGVDFYQRFLGSEFDVYPLWVAHYYESEQPQIDRDWIFWQHSDRGNVNGMTGKVDFNVFSGSADELKNLLLP